MTDDNIMMIAFFAFITIVTVAAIVGGRRD